jgi:hypothetical protein
MDEARNVSAPPQDGQFYDIDDSEMPVHNNNECPSAREYRLLLKAHTDLDEQKFGQIMDLMQRTEESTADAHRAIHSSIQSTNDLVLQGFKTMLRGLISAVVAVVVLFGGAIISLLIYIWLNRDGIIT